MDSLRQLMMTLSQEEQEEDAEEDVDVATDLTVDQEDQEINVEVAKVASLLLTTKTSQLFEQ